MTSEKTAPTVPLLESIDQITPAWLDAALALRHPGSRVDHFTVRPSGAGNVSETVVVDIAYAERPTGAPLSVVAKFRPRDPGAHAHGLASGAYHREIGAYRTVADSGHCRTPHLVHVAGDETNINLLVEDLSAAKPGDQVAGCDANEARAVLTELAGLHGNFPMADESAPAWLIRMREVADYWTEKVFIGSRTIQERYARDLTGEELALIFESTELVNAWHLLDPHRLTLTHGEPRVDNVLFEETVYGTRAVLIDWQVCGLRNPMYDIGYFLSGSISIGDRRTHEDKLLQHYVQHFNSVSETPYDLAEAREDFRLQVLSGLFITTAAVAVLPDNEAVNTLILALLRRNCAAVNDWRAIDATMTAIR